MEILVPRQLDQAQPRTFSGLMELYEQNYMRLRRLIPDIDRLDRRAVSAVRGCMDLHYRHLERSKYTSVFILTYRMEDARDIVWFEPDLKIRIYHDARVAEVLAGQLNQRHHDLTGVEPRAGLFDSGLNNLLPKWRLNRFLYKWLNFCLKQGHRLVPHHSDYVSRAWVD